MLWSENIPGKSPSHFHTKFSHGESESIHVPWTETPIPLEDRNGKAGLAHGETDDFHSETVRLTRNGVYYE